MPIPNRDQWRRVMMATQRVPPPGEGLIEQRAPRLTAYQGFVRVIGHPLAYGWQLGLVTEYDEELDQFVDRGDVPVWVRTPRRQPLEVWRAGCPDGRGVFWGRAQGSVQVSTVVGTGTGSITGASGTGSGDTQTLPVYIVDDCCPEDTGPCTFAGPTVTCVQTTSGTAAAQWTVTVSGLTGDCAAFNGTHVLPNTGSCVWSLEILTGFTITMTVGANTDVSFNVLPTGNTTYRHTGTISGLDSFVAPYFSNTGTCGTTPASVTMVPVP